MRFLIGFFSFLVFLSSNVYAENQILPPTPPNNPTTVVNTENKKPVLPPNNIVYPDGFKKPVTENKAIQTKPKEPEHIDFFTTNKKTKPIKTISSVVQNNTQSIAPPPPNVTVLSSTVVVKDEPQKSPEIIPSKNNATWINNSVSNLDKTGDLKVPSWVDYNSLVAQKDFALMLTRVTKITDKTFFGDLDTVSLDKTLTRGQAFDSSIKAFGLEKEMEKIATSYKSKFKDLKPEHKYYNACITAEVIKLSAGYPDNTFKPDDLLKWSEAIAIIDSVHKWATLMPEQTPIQKAIDFKKNIWYYFLDGFRLVLTLIYSVVSLFFLLKAWKHSRNDTSGFKEIITSLCFATGSLFIMWINEMLYARGIIDKPIYYIISTISVLAGLFLIRTSSLINKQTEPKPKANVEVAYVEYVDISRGEIFVVDSITKRRMLTLISADTKIYNKENKLLGKAFLSEIAVGDVVNIKGTEQASGGSIVKADTILLMASKQNTHVKKHNKSTIEVQEQEEVKIQNIIRRNN